MRPNIYPRTLENITAVLLFYFPKTSHSEINKNAERVYDQRKLKLNELEYVSCIVSKNVNVIRQYYKGIDLNTLLVVGRAVLIDEESTWGVGERSNKLRAIKEGLEY